MKKLILTICAAAALPFAATAQNQDADELMSQLYTPIMQAYQSQNWEEVASLVDKLVAAGADIDELEITYGVALGELGQNGKAVERLKAYTARHPDDVMAWTVMGSCSQRMGDEAQAINAYEKAAEMAPDFDRPAIALARIYGAAQPDKAMENYNKAIRVSLQAQQPATAISIGSEAMALNPKNLQTLMLIGDALSMAGLDENALAFYAEAISVTSAEPIPDVEAMQDCAYHIAMISYKQGNYDRAESLLAGLLGNADYLQQHPEAHVETLCLAAATCQKKGLASDAQAYLAQAEAIDPTARALYDSLLNR